MILSGKMTRSGWCDGYPCEIFREHWERFNLPDQRKNLDEEKERAASFKMQRGEDKSLKLPERFFVITITVI